MMFTCFSFHEMGMYDVPATIDYILEYTNHSQLYYIGHSMGTCMFFVMCSMRPEYNFKIRAQISLAPVGYMHHMTSMLNNLVPFANQIQVCECFNKKIENNMSCLVIHFFIRKLQVGCQMDLFYHKTLPVN